MIAARLAAASCAAGYAWGEDGSNRCPASHFAIDDAAACETAAAAAGKAYIGSETEPSYPSGCFFYQDDDGFYFNADAVGAGKRGTQLLCSSGAARLARPAEAPRDTMVLTAYYGVLKYAASGLKEALDAPHGWMRTASLRGLESGCEGTQEVLWVLHRPLGVLIGY
jgi:hypothetical protein